MRDMRCAIGFNRPGDQRKLNLPPLDRGAPLTAVGIKGSHVKEGGTPSVQPTPMSNSARSFAALVVAQQQVRST